MEILYNHHEVLKKLNNTDHKLEKNIFDFFLQISSDEEPAKPSEYHLSKNSSVMIDNT